MTDTTRAELLTEIGRAARRLGAKSDLLGLIGSWGDTLSEEDVLAGLRRWNLAHPTKPYEAANLSSEDEKKINAALATLTSSARLAPHPATTVEHAIQDEIYRAVRSLGASVELLATLSSWGDTYDDAETLSDLRRFNQTGSMLDSATHDGVLGQDNEPNGPKYD